MEEFSNILREFLSKDVGEDSVPVVDFIIDKRNVSEFKIATRLDQGVNTIRNILYRLNALNLVTSVRKKDRKKGWYIYYWTFNRNQADSTLKLAEEKKRIDLIEKKSEQQVVYLICPSKCYKFTFEEAMEHNFKCPECGKILVEEGLKRKKR